MYDVQLVELILFCLDLGGIYWCIPLKEFYIENKCTTEMSHGSFLVCLCIKANIVCLWFTFFTITMGRQSMSGPPKLRGLRGHISVINSPT